MKTVSVQALLAADARSTGPSTMTRVRGALLMVTGPVLALAMGVALVALGPSLLGAPGAATTAGTREQDLAALVLMVWVALLGLLLAFGGWNLWHRGRLGRRIGAPAAVLVVGLVAASPWLKSLFA